MLLSVPIANIIGATFRWELFAGNINDFIQYMGFVLGALIGFNILYILIWFNKQNIITYLQKENNLHPRKDDKEE